MKQLTRKLSLQATFTSCPSILAIHEQEIYLENLDALTWSYADLALVFSHGAILHVLGFTWPIVAIGLTCQLMYVLLVLPRIFVCFLGRFSFGEGCIIAQSAMLFVYVSSVELTGLQAWSNLNLSGVILKATALTILFVNILELVPGLSWVKKLPYLHSFLALGSLLVFTGPILCYAIDVHDFLNLTYFKASLKSGALIGIWIFTGAFSTCFPQ